MFQKAVTFENCKYEIRNAQENVVTFRRCSSQARVRSKSRLCADSHHDLSTFPILDRKSMRENLFHQLYPS